MYSRVSDAGTERALDCAQTPFTPGRRGKGLGSTYVRQTEIPFAEAD